MNYFLQPLKKNVADTSKLAYRQISEDGIKGKMKQAVYTQIRHEAHHTATELALMMGYGDMNKIRPRIHELFKEGKLMRSGKRVCKISNKLAYTWAINEVL